MFCPNCCSKLNKGKLAEGAWTCNNCNGRWFIVNTTKPKVEFSVLKEIEKLAKDSVGWDQRSEDNLNKIVDLCLGETNERF